MELTNDFRVGIPVPDAWSVLTDVERIAPHLPGAQLQEVEGEEYRGIVKVKVGPITAQYKGTAVFVEKNEPEGRVVLRCTGRDTRGQGNANATITAVMKPDEGGTRVTVTTDLTVTGKVAQFGRGVLADVSSKLMGQFVDALEADLRDNGAAAGGGEPSSSEPSSTTGSAPSSQSVPSQPTPVTASAVAPGAAAQAGGVAERPSSLAGTDASTSEIPASAPATPSGARKINQPDPEPVDLFDAAGGSVAKRFVPVAAVLGALLAALLWRRRGAKRSS
jgi:carbon monoxide dehydrogenase subunit G